MTQEQLETSALASWFPVALQDWLWLHLSLEPLERMLLILLEMPLKDGKGLAGRLSK